MPRTKKTEANMQAEETSKEITTPVSQEPATSKKSTKAKVATKKSASKPTQSEKPTTKKAVRKPKAIAKKETQKEETVVAPAGSEPQKEETKNAPAKKASKKAKSSRKKKAEQKPKTQRRKAQKALIEQAKDVKIERIVETSAENERKKQILETALAKIKAQEEEDARIEALEEQKRERRKFSFTFNFFASLGIVVLMFALYFVLVNRLTFAMTIQSSMSTYTGEEIVMSRWLVTMIYFLFASTLLLTGLIVALFVLSATSKWKYEKFGEISGVHEANWIISLLSFIVSFVTMAFSIIVYVMTAKYYAHFGYAYNLFWMLFPMIANIVVFGLSLTIMILAINSNKKLKS